VRTRVLGLVLGLGAACAPAGAQEQPPPAEREAVLRPGEIMASVRSRSHAEQSYALYLPSGYTPQKRWPVVYVFDPGAMGTRPLPLMKEAAERFGYVVAVSNNSRNGPWKPTLDAASEMWADTHDRLSIDDRRVSFGGFSGGARAATVVAKGCGCARGVFLDGAGFAADMPPAPRDTFAVFATAGFADFNYGELVQLDADLDRAGRRHFFRRWDGDHAWAPAAVWADALAWSALHEMRDGLRNRDDALVDKLLSEALERGRQREQAGELLYALEEYRSWITVFAGLADTARLKERVAALGSDRRIAETRKEEKSGFEKQAGLEASVLGMMDALRAPQADLFVLRSNVEARVRALRRELEREPQPQKRWPLQRVLGSLFVRAMAEGEPLADGGHLEDAVSYFTLATEARPDRAGPHLSLARCHAALGDSKGALRDLTHAVEKGVSAERLSQFVKNDPKLAPLAESDGFRKLLTSASSAER
jgi:hypothetical protein